MCTAPEVQLPSALGSSLLGVKTAQVDLQTKLLQGQLAITRGHCRSLPVTAALKITVQMHKHQQSYENGLVSKVCFNRNISIMYCSLL